MDFEKLDVWKLSTELSVEVYRGMRNLRDFGFKDQITRASLSIPSNIAEGMTRNGHREKLQFLSVAKGSCSELRTQVYIGQQIDYISPGTAKEWIDSTVRIASMISGLVNKIKKDEGAIA
jgi:four helix bundle protein